jgi:hypothetical protein
VRHQGAAKVLGIKEKHTTISSAQNWRRKCAKFAHRQRATKALQRRDQRDRRALSAPISADSVPVFSAVWSRDCAGNFSRKAERDGSGSSSQRCASVRCESLIALGQALRQIVRFDAIANDGDQGARWPMLQLGVTIAAGHFGAALKDFTF